MKKFHNFALPVALVALFSILPDVASAVVNEGSSLVESSYVSVVHKPKKQSTGSWKKNKAKHQELANRRRRRSGTEKSPRVTRKTSHQRSIENSDQCTCGRLVALKLLSKFARPDVELTHRMGRLI